MRQQEVAYLLEQSARLAIKRKKKLLKNFAIHLHYLLGRTKCLNLCFAHLLLVQDVHVLAKSLRHLRYRRLTLDPRAHKEGIPLRVPKHPLIDQVVETLPDVGRGEL